MYTTLALIRTVFSTSDVGKFERSYLVRIEELGLILLLIQSSDQELTDATPDLICLDFGNTPLSFQGTHIVLLCYLVHSVIFSTIQNLFPELTKIAITISVMVTHLFQSIVRIFYSEDLSVQFCSALIASSVKLVRVGLTPLEYK